MTSAMLTLILLILKALRCAGSSLRLHSFIDSHMVLQREPFKARIWGWAASYSNVTVSLNNGPIIGSCIADNHGGMWVIELPPQPASSGHTITVSDGTSIVQLENIAFGDVYLCSGQSNMEMSVLDAFNAEQEIKDSINYPNLRLATASKVEAKIPQRDVISKSNYTWAQSSPEAFGQRSFSYFSATCYFFGRDLYKSFNGEIPIGLVVSCWGGERVEAFSSPNALADRTCGGTDDLGPIADDELNQNEGNLFEKKSTSTIYNIDNAGGSLTDADVGLHDNVFGSLHTDPSDLWNGMIFPLLPMRFVGVVWYQGEANADNATSYACRFPAMIADWRYQFDNPDLSFFYVELAAYHDGSTWPYVRAAQRTAFLLPNVGFATAIDLGDPSSPAGSIHPRRKQEVGRRLSLSVRAVQYKEKVVFEGPTIIAAGIGNGESVTVTLTFDPDSAMGMHFHGSANCTSCCSDSPFEVLDSSGTWVRALESNVESPSEVVVKTQLEPTEKLLGIRYAWEPYPQCILYNGVGGPDDHMGLPAAPFEFCMNSSREAPWTAKDCEDVLPAENPNSQLY